MGMGITREVAVETSVTRPTMQWPSVDISPISGQHLSMEKQLNGSEMKDEEKGRGVERFFWLFER